MSKKTSTIKITKENYGSYVKLYNEKKVIYERNLTNLARFSLGGIMLGFGPTAAGIFSDSKTLLSISIAGMGVLALNINFLSKEANWLSKKQKLKIQREYPNINTKVSYFKLRDILKKEHMIVNGYAKAENYKINQIAEGAKKELCQTSLDNIKNTHFSFRDYKQDCKPLDFPKYLIKR